MHIQKNVWRIVSFSLCLAIVLAFGSCERDKPNDGVALADMPGEFIAYDVFVPNYDNIYVPNNDAAGICDFAILKTNVQELILEQNICGLNIVCLRDDKGNVYAASPDAQNADCYYCFLEIGDDMFPYADTIEIFEYSDVLNKSGFVLSFTAGANYRPILYFYMEDNMPVLLAECNKSSYEIDSGDEKTRKLLSCSGSMIGEAAVYYFASDRIYMLDINAFAYSQFCENNETVSVNYDGSKDKFMIDIIPNAGETDDIISKEAYIRGNALYVKKGIDKLGQSAYNGGKGE